MILALSASFFACGDKTPEEPAAPDKGELALALVENAFPAGQEDKAEIASAILSLLERADLEDAETIAVLSGLKGDAAFMTVALDLKANTYTTDHANLYHTLLSDIATAVGSPEIAGRVFYTAASNFKTDLPYTASDCEKLAPLILGQDLSLGGEVFEAITEGETAGLNEKEVNTMMLTLVSALRKAVGISSSAKSYLLSLATEAVNSFSGEDELGETLADAFEQNKQYIVTIVAAFIDGYDEILSFAADILDIADARLIIGLPYEKEERTIYYGYNYDSWTKTVISKEEYDARAGGYDEYFEDNATVKGFTVNGTFVMISDEDAALADAAYRLSAAYSSYLSLTDEKKQALQSGIINLLESLAEETEHEGATFDELVTALSALTTFDPTDGISAAERSAAQTAVQTFESFINGYLPSDD